MEGKPSAALHSTQPLLRELGARAKPGAGAAVKFGFLPSVGPRRSPHIPPDLPGEEKARAGPRLHALSALSLHPGEGRLASPTRTRSPPLRELGRLLAVLLSLPATAAARPLPSRGPAPPLPHPGPRPGLSRTSLRSWRPHVFAGLSAPVDVVSRSDFQARPQLRRQHQPGPSRAPRRGAPRRRRARPPPLKRPPRPAPARPRLRARRAQPCHPPTKAAAAARTSPSGGAGSRRGSCRHPSPFSRRRRRRLEPWPPPPACPPCRERPQDCELVPLTCWAGLRAPALGPDGSPGWDSGLLELMSSWGSAETGYEVSRGEGLRGGGRGGLRGAGDRGGRGWTSERAVGLEREETKREPRHWEDRGERKVELETGWPCRGAVCLSTWEKISGVPHASRPRSIQQGQFPSPTRRGALPSSPGKVPGWDRL